MNSCALITFRPVRKTDAVMLVAWRNDEETRRNSRRKARIEGPPEEWLERFCAEQSDRRLYIAVHEETLIGLVYTDKHSEFYEISYVVAPQSRGQGYGLAMVETFVRQYLSAVSVKAYIYKGNIQSEKIARTIGLHPFVEAPADPDGRILVEWVS